MRRRLAVHERSGSYGRTVRRVLPPRTDHLIDPVAAHRWLDLADRYDVVMVFSDKGAGTELEAVIHRAMALGLTVEFAYITPLLEQTA